MRKGINKGGDNIFIIKVDMAIDKHAFAKAIAHHHWRKNIEFDPSMKRSDATSILKQELFHHGVSGVYTDHWDAASEEYIGVFDRVYDATLRWIDINYPYLNK